MLILKPYHGPGSKTINANDIPPGTVFAGEVCKYAGVFISVGTKERGAIIKLSRNADAQQDCLWAWGPKDKGHWGVIIDLEFDAQIILAPHSRPLAIGGGDHGGRDRFDKWSQAAHAAQTTLDAEVKASDKEAENE